MLMTFKQESEGGSDMKSDKLKSKLKFREQQQQEEEQQQHGPINNGSCNPRFSIIEHNQDLARLQKTEDRTGTSHCPTFQSNSFPRHRCATVLSVPGILYNPRRLFSDSHSLKTQICCFIFPPRCSSWEDC